METLDPLVDDEIKDDLHATVMAALHERFTVGQGAVWFVDVAVVGDVVALEARRGFKGRRERESAPSTFASTGWEALDTESREGELGTSLCQKIFDIASLQPQGEPNALIKHLGAHSRRP